MDARKIIQISIQKKKEIRAVEIAQSAGVSRQYVNKILQELENDGMLTRIGKSNRSRYVVSEARSIERAKRKESLFVRTLINNNLLEDQILDQIRHQTGILLSVPQNIQKIVEYAFTEMTNNAIEHSQTEKIFLKMQRGMNGIQFTVFDHGVGIFNNIMEKKNLANELEAIQDLLKGKQTTMPEQHSGEGIFFTSKLAEKLSIKSFKKKLLYDNIMNDILVTNITPLKGTRVDFRISFSSTVEISDVFKRYTGNEFEFGTTEVAIGLYKSGVPYVSRSQARRVVSGLEQFNKIILDFKNMDTIGQAFADEIFRVWKNRYPGKEIVVRNAGENVQFMIDHVTR